jgi:hypothetical protein
MFFHAGKTMSLLVHVSDYQHALTIAHTRVLLPVAVAERLLDRTYVKAETILVVLGLPNLVGVLHGDYRPPVQGVLITQRMSKEHFGEGPCL